MVVAPCRTISPLDELGYPVVGPHSWTHRRHFVGHVGEVPGPDARRGLALGRALHLEHTDGVGLVDRLVHRFIGKIDSTEVDVLALPLFDELQGFLHLR